MREYTEEEMLLLFKDEQKKNELIDNLNGEDLKELLIYINSKVRGISIEDGGIYTGEKMMAGALVSPKGAIQQEYFEKMADLLKKVDGNERKATVMYYLINQLHLFRDGNGRTSRCVYELLSNGDFDINNNDYFSHNERDMAKIPSWKFERDKGMLSAQYAGSYASCFIYKYLAEQGLTYMSEDLKESLAIRTNNDAAVQEYTGVYISDEARKTITTKEVNEINRALLDNNEWYSVAGLTMLIMLNMKKNKTPIEELSYSGKRLPKQNGFVNRDVIWIDDEEKREVSDKSMKDWTREDYVTAIEVADKIKEMMLDTLIDMFENPESFRLENGQSVVDFIMYYEKPDIRTDINVRDSAKLNGSIIEINENMLMYKDALQLSEILSRTKTMPKPQSVQTLGMQVRERLKEPAIMEQEERNINVLIDQQEVENQRGE